MCPFRDVLTWGKRDRTLFLCVSLSMDLPLSPRRRIALGQANLFHLDNTQRKLGMASLVAQMVKHLLQCGRPGFSHWVRKIPWRRKWQPTPVLLPGKFQGWRSLVGYSPWGHKELDMTEQLHFHVFSLSRVVCRQCFQPFQFSSGTQSCLTLCNPMECSMPVLPVHHQLSQFTHTHVH